MTELDRAWAAESGAQSASCGNTSVSADNMLGFEVSVSVARRPSRSLVSVKADCRLRSVNPATGGYSGTKETRRAWNGVENGAIKKK